MSNHKDLTTTIRQILAEEAKSKNDLKKIAASIADDTARAINKLTPASVSDMPYARQYTLEEVIRILESRV
jgi:septal ring factor EnvC (AmiA/AmiB activator)